MKTRSVNAQLFEDMLYTLSALITYAELMVTPTPEKETFLNEARAVYQRARKQNQEEG